jgi:hypothetical protein
MFISVQNENSETTQSAGRKPSARPGGQSLPGLCKQPGFTCDLYMV